jgi:hypothetical protein
MLIPRRLSLRALFRAAVSFSFPPTIIRTMTKSTVDRDPRGALRAPRSFAFTGCYRGIFNELLKPKLQASYFWSRLAASAAVIGMAAAIQFASRDEHLLAAAEDASLEGVYAGEKDSEGRRHGLGQVSLI